MGNNSDWTQISLNKEWLSRICGIRNNGELYCWGSNQHGQLGDVTNNDHSNRIGNNSNWADISLGSGSPLGGGRLAHICGFLNNGDLYCWGNNLYGQLGDGTNGDHSDYFDTSADKNIPTLIDFPSFCGDGLINTGEECDNGANNSDTLANACRSNCLVSSCGDGIKDTGEGCDDGANNSDSGACSTLCILATCGNGTVDTGEACDDGANNSDIVADACRTNCLYYRCGDGFVDTGEACDDGANNSNEADTCRIDCSSPSCGDGFVDTGEVCDEGLTPNQDCMYAETSCTVCSSSCEEVAGTTYFCGDGILDIGEDCDEGPTPNQDCMYDKTSCTVCSSSCEEVAGAIHVCGDAFIDTADHTHYDPNNISRHYYVFHIYDGILMKHASNRNQYLHG